MAARGGEPGALSGRERGRKRFFAEAGRDALLRLKDLQELLELLRLRGEFLAGGRALLGRGGVGLDDLRDLRDALIDVLDAKRLLVRGLRDGFDELGDV